VVANGDVCGIEGGGGDLDAGGRSKRKKEGEISKAGVCDGAVKSVSICSLCHERRTSAAAGEEGAGSTSAAANA